MTVVSSVFWTKAPKGAFMAIRGVRETHKVTLKWSRSDGVRIVSVTGIAGMDILQAQDRGVSLGARGTYLAVDPQGDLVLPRIDGVCSTIMGLMERVNRLLPGPQVEISFGDPELDSLPNHPPGFPEGSWETWWEELGPLWRSVIHRKFPLLARKAQEALNKGS